MRICKESSDFLEIIADFNNGFVEGNKAFCSVCGEVIGEFTADYRIVEHPPCFCEKNRIEDRKLARKKELMIERVRDLKFQNPLGDKYANVNFKNTEFEPDTSFAHALNRCQLYCEHYQDVMKNGWGIYLCGKSGVGKTHLAACIANYFLDKGVPVLFTCLSEFARSVRHTFNAKSEETELDFFNKISLIDLLVLDDIGTDRFFGYSETWVQNLLFDVIDKRYKHSKPTIFTSNYKHSELVNERGVMEKTVARIADMAGGAFIKIVGENFREKYFRRELPF